MRRRRLLLTLAIALAVAVGAGVAVARSFRVAKSGICVETAHAGSTSPGRPAGAPGGVPGPAVGAIPASTAATPQGAVPNRLTDTGAAAKQRANEAAGRADGLCPAGKPAPTTTPHAP